MKTIICDASPLIFLAKIDGLGLTAEVLGGEIHVLQCVVDEACNESADPLELVRLERFFEKATVVDYKNADFPSSTLSESDRSTLNWAIENRPDWLVADERLLRRVAAEEGVSVIGVFGILLEAARQEIRTPGEIKQAVDDLVGKHGCRISIALYQRVLEEIESLGEHL